MARRPWGWGLGCFVLAGLLWSGPAAAAEEAAAYGTAAAELTEQLSSMFPKVSGRVIGLEQERVLLDLSAKDKAIPGLELQVFRPGEEFKHPFTGQSLGKMDRDVGRVRILEVHPAFSLAEVIQQAEGTLVQQGDLVRVPSARVILALPNVDVADVLGANSRSVTRDLVNALLKTTRFEVMPDQRIRAALTEEKLEATEPFTDPAVLQVLWKRLRVSAILLAKLSLMEKAVRWDVQVVSTVRGDSVGLASAEVKGVAPKFMASGGRSGGGSGDQDSPRIDQIALRGQALPFKASVMAVGDFTGDGNPKAAVSDGQGVFIYDLDKGGLKLLWSTPGTTNDHIISLDAGDINQNGVPEIFVTNLLAGNNLQSYVLEYQKGTFVKISQGVPLHFRVISGLGNAPQLYGQAAGDNRPFEGPVRRYTWQGGRYAPADTVNLPKRYNIIYGFTLADLDGEGAPKVLILDTNDYLRVYDRAGTELYRTSERYGGSERVLEFSPEGVKENSRSGIEPERLTLQGRMYFQDVLGNGKKQLILPKNTPSTGYVFKTRLYDRGKIFGLAWDGMGLQSTWETRELPGYVADFALIGGEGEDRRLVVLVVQTNFLGMGTSRSTIVLLDLRPPA
jgi:hypothetical protein